MRILVVDTETTGLPKSRNGSIFDQDNWPYIVQFSYIIYELDTQTIEKMVDHIIKLPDGIDIPDVCVSINGISNEIGTAESETYNQSTSQALTTLIQTLSTAKSDLTSSLGQITGAESTAAPDAFDAGLEDGEMDADLGMGDETDMDMPEPEETPDLSSDETDEIGSAGRELR